MALFCRLTFDLCEFFTNDFIGQEDLNVYEENSALIKHYNRPIKVEINDPYINESTAYRLNFGF